MPVSASRTVAAALAGAIVVLLAEPARATTRLVPSEIPTIQAALDSSAAGDTVLVAPGEYAWDTGPLTFRGRNLVLRSEAGPTSTILRGTVSLSDGLSRAARLQGFTIHAGDVGFGGALAVHNASPTIDDCMVIRNRGSGLTPGILVSGGDPGYADPLISNCVIAFNEGGQYASAIAVISDAGAVISDCTIFGNGSGAGNCVSTGAQILEVTSGGVVFVTRTIVAGSPDQPAVTGLGWCGSVLVSCSNFYGNACGDYVGCVAGWLGVDGNFSADPLFCDPTRDALDFTLATNSPCLPGNHPDGWSCNLIGARGEGCAPPGPTATGATSWGAIKAAFR